MNFEQLLDAAEKPAPDPIEWAPPITMTMPLYTFHERVCRPSVMRGVWAALKETKRYCAENNLSSPSVDRALALLDGQKEK